MIDTRTVRTARPPRPIPTRRVANPATGERTRFAEFDAIRATAILLVVTLHAALAYTHDDVPRLLWGVREPSSGRGFDLFCRWAMGVSVPVFFAVAGFFAAAIHEGRGGLGFLANRARRVGLPFVVGSVTVLPACFAAWAYG